MVFYILSYEGPEGMEYMVFTRKDLAMKMKKELLAEYGEQGGEFGGPIIEEIYVEKVKKDYVTITLDGAT